MKKLFVIAISILFAVNTLAATQSSANSPTKAIQELDKKLDNFKTGTLTPEEKEYNQNLKREIIHGTFDIKELARLSLFKHWDTLSVEKQNEFVDLLTNILEEKALLSKEQSASKSKRGGKYTVSYSGEKFTDQEKKRAFVRTTVHVTSENISLNLNYKMRKNDDEWKIFDVIVDDASLVDNYRYQFDSIIKKHGYDELVRRMKDKLAEIRGKRGQAVVKKDQSLDLGANK